MYGYALFKDVNGVSHGKIRTNNYYSIYGNMMEATGNDHEVSANAASWCELAGIGEVYEFREGTIEIVEE